MGQKKVYRFSYTLALVIYMIFMISLREIRAEELFNRKNPFLSIYKPFRNLDNEFIEDLTGEKNPDDEGKNPDNESLNPEDEEMNRGEGEKHQEDVEVLPEDEEADLKDGQSAPEDNDISLDEEEIDAKDEESDNIKDLASDGSNFIDIFAKDVEIIDSTGKSNEELHQEFIRLFTQDLDSSTSLLEETVCESPYVIFDFKTEEVNLSRIELISGKEEELTVYGSNDGQNWMLLSKDRVMAEAAWQTITIKEDIFYRYIKIDSTNLLYETLSDLKFFGQIKIINYNLPQATLVSIFSDNFDMKKAYPGDQIAIMVELTESLKEDQAELEILFNEQPVSFFEFYDGFYYAELVVSRDDLRMGIGEISVNLITKDGQRTEIANNTTDETYVFISDDTNMIDLLNDKYDVANENWKYNQPETFSQVYSVSDNKMETYSEFTSSGDGTNSFIVLDFKTACIQLTRVEVLARQDDYYSRIEGMTIYASTNGKSWTEITTSRAENTKQWQALMVEDTKAYRYLQITNANAWYGNMAEIRLFSAVDRDNVKHEPEVISASLSSSNADPKRAFPGDLITLTFTTKEEVKNYSSVLEVLLCGQTPWIQKIGDCTYKAEIIADERFVGLIEFTIGYNTLSGQQEHIAIKTTDNSSIFVSSQKHVVNIDTDDIDVLVTSNGTEEEKKTQIGYLFDNNPYTYSEFIGNDGGKDVSLIFDFKREVFLSRMEVLARQDELYHRAAGISVLGSKDGLDWEEMNVTYTQATKEWQNVYLSTTESYRYIKLTNVNDWYGSMAELQLFYKKENEPESPDKNMSLGWSIIGKPTSTSDDAEKWTGSKVYIGQQGSTGLLWRVLDPDDAGGALLFSEAIIEKSTSEIEFLHFHHKFAPARWATCTSRHYLNGYMYYGSYNGGDLDVVIDYTKNGFIYRYFSELEIASMKETLVKQHAACNGTEGGPDCVDKLFFLSINEVKNIRYGFANDATRADANGLPLSHNYWLRIPGYNDGSYTATVANEGKINEYGAKNNTPYQNQRGIRPAFRLDIDSVLFTTASEISKIFHGNFGSNESKVTADNITDTWKLTLKGTEQTLEAATQDSTILSVGLSKNLVIEHKSAVTVLDNAKQVSAMLVDEGNNILYYGKINSDLNSTSSTVKIPQLMSGKYRLLVFAETINGNYNTDYATPFSEIDIHVTDEIPVADIIINQPSNLVAGEPIILSGEVQPANASYDLIEFSLIDAGIGTYIKDNVLYVSGMDAGGTIKIKAVVRGGNLGEDYVKEFTLQVDKKPELPSIPVSPPDSGSNTDTSQPSVPVLPPDYGSDSNTSQPNDTVQPSDSESDPNTSQPGNTEQPAEPDQAEDTIQPKPEQPEESAKPSDSESSSSTLKPNDNPIIKPEAEKPQVETEKPEIIPPTIEQSNEDESEEEHSEGNIPESEQPMIPPDSDSNISNVTDAEKTDDVTEDKSQLEIENSNESISDNSAAESDDITNTQEEDTVATVEEALSEEQNDVIRFRMNKAVWYLLIGIILSLAGYVFYKKKTN